MSLPDEFVASWPRLCVWCVTPLDIWNAYERTIDAPSDLHPQGRFRVVPLCKTCYDTHTDDELRERFVTSRRIR